MLMHRSLPTLLYAHGAPLRWLRRVIASVKEPLALSCLNRTGILVPVPVKPPGIRRRRNG